MKQVNFFVSVIFAMSISPAYADFMEGTAALSSGNPHIPEPLLFDLVRPLGAKKGELEVNALAQQPAHGGVLEWAPEIEYAIANGLAVEFELPTENSKVTDYKFALQGTLDSNFNNPNLIQGWQVIVKKNRETGKYASDALYIHGYRLTDHWSTLNMIGLRNTAFGKNNQHVGLINNNVFYDFTPKVTAGFELNHELSEKGQWRYSATPQLHLDLSSHMTVQVGAGLSRLNQAKSAEKLFALRMIYAF